MGFAYNGCRISISIITKPVAKSRVLIQTPVYHHFLKIPSYSNLDLLVNKLVVNGDTYNIDFFIISCSLNTIDYSTDWDGFVTNTILFEEDGIVKETDKSSVFVKSHLFTVQKRIIQL